MKRCDHIITLLLFFFTINIFAQNVTPPMDIPLYLSGNFGELRANHFHSGIDFKTQGKQGIPVKSVKEGFVSRISVSPYGYGRAIYIDHPDGLTSVYGHLSKFAPGIESAVRDSQYHKETFTLNLYFEKEDFPVKQGEIIAYSGNTGGSGGPHLHFEFRDTESEHPIDPLPFFRDKIRDTRPPDIQSIMIFPQFGKGVVNDSDKKQAFQIIKDKSGKQQISDSIYVWGDIAVGVKAYDKMSETSNIYAVKEIVLKVDGTDVFHSVINRFSFDDTRYLNSFIDWENWRDNRSFFMKSFIEPGNRLDFYQTPYNGIVSISEERPYQCEYILKDLYGNTSRFSFSIFGKESMIPEKEESAIFFPYNQNNSYRENGIDLEIPRKNLYTDLRLNISVIPDHTEFSPLYVIGEHIPLHSYCPLTLDIANDTYSDKPKYGIISVYNGRISWIGGEYQNGKMSGKIRELGNYSILADTVPPSITSIQPTKWTSLRKISFKVTDDLSGISEWKGTIDGQFVLFEYDAKTNLLFYEYDPKRMKPGKKRLHLTVRDSAGNLAEFDRSIQL